MITSNKIFHKGRIFNDPIYGFISIEDEIIFRLIEHPYFQRLRRIHQLGLTHLVYSGAHHTRFHHAIGAMYLTKQAVDTLKRKGTVITPEEELGVLIAILLHDIGHGPFSHTLENSIVENIHHETISTIFMKKLNEEFDGQLSLAIEIFNNTYPKKFLHLLVSSQLDMDRLDYLQRDSFFSGVVEGSISSERIIKMLVVANEELAIEEKGIYSVENFLIARRLMYWQVYLHKTVLSAEFLLMNTLKRAKFLAKNNKDIFATPALKQFIYQNYTLDDFDKHAIIDKFALLDDYDIMASIKVWAFHEDKILSLLASNTIHRNLYKIKLSSKPFSEKDVLILKDKTKKLLNISDEEVAYFVFTGTVTNSAYNPKKDKINILYKDGSINDIAHAADLLNISALAKDVEKHYLCFPREINL
jgi:uncharacterized protein